MKNDEYWARRQAQNMYEYMEGAEETAAEIAQLYWKASHYLSDKADEIFEKFMVKFGLSEPEARRLLNELQDRESLDELMGKLREGGGSESRQELLRQLEAPAYQARLERLRELQNQVDWVMTQVYHLERQKSAGYYVDLANEAYYKSMFQIQQQAGVAFSFSCVDAKTIDQVVGSQWSGENYSQRIWKNTQALAKDLKEQLLLGLVTGKTNREMANEIQNKYAVGAYKARRLVRTESNYIAGEMNTKAYEEAEVERYCFCAILDLRTSKVCRELDGKIFPVKERKVGLNCHPMHPFCRSTTIAVVSDDLFAKLGQRFRDPVTGKIIKVDKALTYKEWYAKYVKGRPEAELAEKQIKNRASDQKQHKKYRAILGEDVPESLDDFQKMKYTDSKKWENMKSVKQDALNKMDFSDMGELVGKLGNKEVRIWYKNQDEKIPGRIDTSLSKEKQARQAHQMRNENRTAARELMRDQEKRGQLDIDYPNKTFEEMLKYKMNDKGLSYEQALDDIIATSAKTNMRVNKLFGLE